MCGIVGFAGSGTRTLLEKMTKALHFRGPDGGGVYVDDELPVFLGHRRLAIRDLKNGAQPMWDGMGEICVVYNGEIYNHAELRRELESCGYRFSTSHCDTEILVHGYREWGKKLPAKLNGMFAFTIFDKRKNQLFLARDRFGEKPLFYARSSGFFAFASELNALALHPKVGSSVNVASLKKLFAYGYLPAPNALYAGTAKLPGGHSLTYDVKSGRELVECYWKFDLFPDSADVRDEAELVDELHELIKTAANRRLIADVPVGILLSGGIDSSLVLSAVAEGGQAEKIETFTLGFAEKSFDETAFAQVAADLFGTRHRTTTLQQAQAIDLIPSVLSRMDEPLGDPSILPSYALCKFAKQHVGVVLSGDGGDELFAGYDPFAALAFARIYKQIMPDAVHSKVRRLAEFLPVSYKNISIDFKIKRTLTGLSYPDNIRLPVWMAPLEPSDIEDLLNEPVDHDELFSEAITIWDECAKLNDAEKAMVFFTRIYLPDNILVKSDRASMMNSLETRAVYLDNDLVDFCQRLPTRYKHHKGERKILLKRVAERVLPKEIVNRKKKGFGMPIGNWLKTLPHQPPLKPLPGMDSGFAAKAFATHRSGEKDNRMFLWSWISAQQVINGQG